MRAFEDAGAAAIQLEDQAFPKKCGHLPDKHLVTQKEFISKLGAALDARDSALVIARTDARTVLGLDAAIDRANAYADAGADLVFIESPLDSAEVARIADSVSAPLVINLVQGGLTPDDGPVELDRLGYAIAIHPSNPLVAATNASIDALQQLNGKNPRRAAAGVASFFDLVGLREWSAIGKKWDESA